MIWSLTSTSTGTLGVCICAVMLLHCSYSSARSNIQVRAPTIVSVMQKNESNHCTITCKVNSGGLPHETVVYWLAGGEFVELVHKNITMISTLKRSPDGTEYLLLKMMFRELSPEILNTKFTCVALSPAGFDNKIVRIRKVC